MMLTKTEIFVQLDINTKEDALLRFHGNTVGIYTVDSNICQQYKGNTQFIFHGKVFTRTRSYVTSDAHCLFCV
jgi:hypothetical protein